MKLIQVLSMPDCFRFVSMDSFQPPENNVLENSRSSRKYSNQSWVLSSVGLLFNTDETLNRQGRDKFTDGNDYQIRIRIL